MRQFKLYLLGIVYACVVAPAAFAYQVGDLNLEPLVAVHQTYDSNITESHSQVISDGITRILGGIKGSFEGRNQTASFGINIDQEIFARHSEFNNLAEDLTGKYKVELDPYNRLNFDNTFVHAQEPYTFADQFGRTAGRYDYYKNNCNGGWTHDFTSQLSTQLKYGQNYYDPQRKDLSKSDQYKPGIEVDYAFSSKLQGMVFYDYSLRTFDPGESISKNSPGVGMREYFTPKLYIDGRAALDVINISGRKSLLRPKYSAGLYDQKNESTLYGITFSKEYADTAYEQNLFDSWQAQANMQKQIFERLQMTGNVFIGGGEYQNLGIRDSLYGIGTVLTYGLIKDWDFSLGYNFTKKDSNSKSRTYNKNVVFLDVMTHF